MANQHFFYCGEISLYFWGQPQWSWIHWLHLIIENRSFSLKHPIIIRVTNNWNVRELAIAFTILVMAMFIRFTKTPIIVILVTKKSSSLTCFVFWLISMEPLHFGFILMPSSISFYHILFLILKLFHIFIFWTLITNIPYKLCIISSLLQTLQSLDAHWFYFILILDLCALCLLKLLKLRFLSGNGGRGHLLCKL